MKVPPIEQNTLMMFQAACCKGQARPSFEIRDKKGDGIPRMRRVQVAWNPSIRRSLRSRITRNRERIEKP